MPSHSHGQSPQQSRKASGLRHHCSQPGHQDPSLNQNPQNLQTIRCSVRTTPQATLHPSRGKQLDLTLDCKEPGEAVSAIQLDQDRHVDKRASGLNAQICAVAEQRAASGVRGWSSGQGQPDHGIRLHSRFSVHFEVRSVGIGMSGEDHEHLRGHLRDSMILE